jgi:hypothetical protein
VFSALAFQILAICILKFCICSASNEQREIVIGQRHAALDVELAVNATHEIREPVGG